MTSNSPSSTKPSGSIALHAERGDLVARVLVADGRGHARARHHAELHGGHPDPARGAVHEQPLAHGQARLGEERVVRGGEGLRDTARGGPVELVGNRHRGALVHDRVLRLAASGDDRHHAIAGLEAAGAAPAGDDLARELQARDVGGRARRRGIMPGELHHVGAVEPGGLHADQQLPVLGLRIRVFGDLDLAVANGGGTHYGEGTPRSAGDVMRLNRVRSGRGRLASPLSPALARKPRRCRGGRALPELGLARRWRARRRRPPGPADPGVHGRRRFDGDDDPLAARERLPHAPGRNPRERGLQRGIPDAVWRRGWSSCSPRPGERVAIIGQSRGGVFARVLGVRRPDLVSGIVTLGSPTVRQLSTHPFVLAQILFVGALGTGKVPGMFRVSCLRGACCERFRADLANAFPREVGFTALYSKTDGVVDWRACLDPAAEQVEVHASHLGMGLNAEVYAELGNALGRFVSDDGQYWAQAA